MTLTRKFVIPKFFGQHQPVDRDGVLRGGRFEGDMGDVGAGGASERLSPNGQMDQQSRGANSPPHRNRSRKYARGRA